ncbi:MAG: hypothetical protein QM754_05155 [Tepidisphaeraceae bacterium]
MPIDLPAAVPPSPPSTPMVTSTQPAAWRPRESVVAEFEKARPGFVFRDERLPKLDLPPLLRTPDGHPITAAKEWETLARPAVLEAFRRFVYGRSPAVPSGVKTEVVAEDKNAINGSATHRRLRVAIPVPGAANPFTFEYSVFTPNDRPGKVGAFLLLNNRSVRAADPTRQNKSDFWPVETIVSRGYAAVALQLTSVQPDKPDGLSAGIVAALPSDAGPDERWATIAAWAWAASRVVDGLLTLPEIDAKRIAVVGHSRGGKTALWAGATDERFAMVFANGSGCGGAALSRRPFGETVAKINEVFPHWFCENFKTFNGQPEKLPVDQHQLIAAVLPRPVYIGCADEDLWADPRGEFIALAEASSVAALYGQAAVKADELPPINQPFVRGPLGYHVRTGVHDLTLYDWQQFLSFADKNWQQK